MLCSNVLNALRRTELNFGNENATFCSSASSFHWFNTTESLALTQIIVLYEVKNLSLENFFQTFCFS